MAYQTSEKKTYSSTQLQTYLNSWQKGAVGVPIVVDGTIVL
jgi:hypothetical protein